MCDSDMDFSDMDDDDMDDPMDYYGECYGNKKNNFEFIGNLHE